MAPFLSAVAIAFGAIFVAEFGDKSQLLVLAFATRYPWQPVVIGLVIAAAIIQGISVAIGAAVGAVLPETAVAVVAGIAFLGVALWTLRADDEDELEERAWATEPGGGIRLIAMVAGTFIVAELGDKTMLATFALAASQGPIPTWIGATAAMVAANLVAVVVGRTVGSRLSPRAVRIGSAALFALGGIAILLGALLAAD
jgi:putative Ca2+/H+ antiporter (TMEM165/GDT1 family)